MGKNDEKVSMRDGNKNKTKKFVLIKRPDNRIKPEKRKKDRRKEGIWGFFFLFFTSNISQEYNEEKNTTRW